MARYSMERQKLDILKCLPAITEQELAPVPDSTVQPAGANHQTAKCYTV
ncbi:MAG TPA: hypothetical protein VE957_14585 [Terriglobales bacterium]|nr:hypothetical protein [Terriglobales bacterium]